VGPTLVLLFFFGLSAATVGKIKGSSFFIWFFIGFFVPVLGTVAAVLYRNERFVAKRRCPECGKVLQIYDQVCKRCGRDLEFPAPEPGQRQEQLF
jgi:rRNA maturation protein Nop10